MSNRMGKMEKVVVFSLIGIAVLMLIIAFTDLAFASPLGNPGEKVGTWVKDQIFWIGVAIIAVTSIGFIAKRNWVDLGIFILIAGIVLVIISNPQRLKSIGDGLFSLMGF